MSSESHEFAVHLIFCGVRQVVSAEGGELVIAIRTGRQDQPPERSPRQRVKPRARPHPINIAMSDKRKFVNASKFRKIFRYLFTITPFGTNSIPDSSKASITDLSVADRRLSPLSKRATVSGDSRAAFARSRTPHPSAVRAILH